MKKLIDVGDRFVSKKYGYIVTIVELPIGKVCFSAQNRDTVVEMSKADFFDCFKKFLEGDR